MAGIEMDLHPVSHITTDAIGKPGERVFYIQGKMGDQVVTLLVEKVQIQTLSVGVEQFLGEIKEQYPDLLDASNAYEEDEMHISPPVDPLFRIGEMGLGYDNEEDLVVLIAREVSLDDQETEDLGVVRFWCTRSQILALCVWGAEVVSHGRQICPQCGEPMDPAGHFCPKKNGHKH